jgi:hypothetical protein
MKVSRGIIIKEMIKVKMRWSKTMRIRGTDRLWNMRENRLKGTGRKGLR